MGGDGAGDGAEVMEGFAQVGAAEVCGDAGGEAVAGADEGEGGFAQGVGVAKIGDEGVGAVGEGFETGAEESFQR